MSKLSKKESLEHQIKVSRGMIYSYHQKLAETTDEKNRKNLEDAIKRETETLEMWEEKLKSL